MYSLIHGFMFQAWYSTPRSSAGRAARTRAGFPAIWPTSAGPSQSHASVLEPNPYGSKLVLISFRSGFGSNELFFLHVSYQLPLREENTIHCYQIRIEECKPNFDPSWFPFSYVELRKVNAKMDQNWFCTLRSGFGSNELYFLHVSYQLPLLFVVRYSRVKKEKKEGSV